MVIFNSYVSHYQRVIDDVSTTLSRSLQASITGTSFSFLPGVEIFEDRQLSFEVRLQLGLILGRAVHTKPIRMATMKK